MFIIACKSQKFICNPLHFVLNYYLLLHDHNSRTGSVVSPRY